MKIFEEYIYTFISYIFKYFFSDVLFRNPILAAHLQAYQSHENLTQQQKLTKITKIIENEEPELDISTIQELNKNQKSTDSLVNNNSVSCLSSSVTPDSTVQIPPTKLALVSHQLTASSSESVFSKLDDVRPVRLVTKRATLCNGDESVESNAKRSCLEIVEKSTEKKDNDNEENEAACNDKDISVLAKNNSPSVSTTSEINGTTVNNQLSNDVSRSPKSNNVPVVSSPNVSLAPKIVLKKKNNTYAADIIELHKIDDIKPDIVLLKENLKISEKNNHINDINFEKEYQNLVNTNLLKENSNSQICTNYVENPLKDDNSIDQNQVSTTTAPTSDLSNKNESETVNYNSAEVERESDTWDDYCFVCNQGCDDTTGDLGCCALCPHVFHNTCHIPEICEQMSELPLVYK